MRRLALIIVTAILPFIGAFATTNDIRSACWGASAVEDSTNGGLEDHGNKVMLRGFIDSTISLQTVGEVHGPR